MSKLKKILNDSGGIIRCSSNLSVVESVVGGDDFIDIVASTGLDDRLALEAAERADESNRMLSIMAIPLETAYEFPWGETMTYARDMFDDSMARIEAGLDRFYVYADGRHEGDFQTLLASSAVSVGAPGWCSAWVDKEAEVVRVAANVIDTTAGDDSLKIVAAGIGTYCSVGAHVPEWDVITADDGTEHYRWIKGAFKEVSLVAYPKFEQTSVTLMDNVMASESVADTGADFDALVVKEIGNKVEQIMDSYLDEIVGLQPMASEQPAKELETKPQSGVEFLI